MNVKNKCLQKTNRKYNAYIVLKWNQDKKINMVSSYWEGKFGKFILQN